MTETSHAHVPIMAIVTLMLTHLMIFSPLSERAKRVLISASFASALASEGAGWLVRFVSPAFAWLKIAGFVAFQACLGYLIIGLGMFLLGSRGKRKLKTGA